MKTIMKNIGKIMASFACIYFLLASCGRNSEAVSPFGWTPVNPDFDSLTVVAEKRFNFYASADSLQQPISEMEKIDMRKGENGEIHARTLYWKGRFLYATGDTEEGDRLLRKALSLTDSAKYPHTFNRIVWNLDMDYHEPTPQRYNFLKKQYEFFLESGDIPVAADYAMETGMFLSEIKDWERAEYYLGKADSLFKAGGFRQQVSNNRINHANILLSRGDTVSSLNLMQATLADTAAPVAERVRDILLGNISELTGDSASLNAAYRAVRSRYNTEDMECLYQSRIAESKILAGQLDSAAFYLKAAAQNLEYAEDPHIRYEYLQARSNFHHAAGQPDSAYRYLKMASDLHNNLRNEETQQEIRNMNVAADIEILKLQNDITKRRTLIWILSLSLLLLLVSSLAALIYSRLQKQRLAKARTDLELERANRKLMATEIVLEEKTKILKELESEVRNLKDEGEINDTAARKIDNSIKVHLGSTDNSEGFLKTFGSLAPQFVVKLKSNFPDLTEADIRLASYISVGLDNKHIARVMAIRPESVKQARWRLRSKLKLNQRDSLEDYLRNFIK